MKKNVIILNERNKVEERWLKNNMELIFEKGLFYGYLFGCIVTVSLLSILVSVGVITI